MTRSQTELVARARRRLQAIEKRRKDPRFARVIGRLCAAGHLTVNFPVEGHKSPIRVADALWVGEVEPRVLELLPALIVKVPSLFEDPRDLPPDLALAVRSLQRNEVPGAFRGIPGEDVQRWLTQVGRKGKAVSRLKAFRLKANELSCLEELSGALGVTETDVIRLGLRELAAKHLLGQQR